MTPEAAFAAWLAAAVGARAYADGHVPDSATYPFVTFTLPASCWGAAPTAATVDLWTRGEGEAATNARARALSRAIGLGGVLLACDGGGMWLTRGEPWCQAVADEDPAVSRRRINVSVEWMTTD